MDNCSYKAILNVTDPESQRYFSDMIGSIDVMKKSISETVSASHGENSGWSWGDVLTPSDGKSKSRSKSISASASVVREPIVFPHEMATLDDILLLTPKGFCRVNKLPYYTWLHRSSQ